MENNIKEITKNLAEMLNFAGNLIKEKEKELETPEQKRDFLKALESSGIVNKIEEAKNQLKNI
jgi:hypothetical protein